MRTWKMEGPPEMVLGIDGERTWLPMQPGDVPQTWACVDKAARLFGYAPTTSLHEGLQNFAGWLFSGAEAERVRYPVAERTAVSARER